MLIHADSYVPSTSANSLAFSLGVDFVVAVACFRKMVNCSLSTHLFI